jgi:hypothetical protein
MNALNCSGVAIWLTRYSMKQLKGQDPIHESATVMEDAAGIGHHHHHHHGFLSSCAGRRREIFGHVEPICLVDRCRPWLNRLFDSTD